MMTIASKSPRTPAQYGRDCERDAEKLLRKQGYTVTRSHLSRGAADLVAIDAAGVTRLIQVKSCQVFKAIALNRGIMAILEAPPVHSREAWLYLHGRGLVAVVAFAPDRRFSIVGKEPYRSEVKAAVAALLNRIAQRRRA